MYTDFAGVYDRLMADVDYQGWAAFYQEMLTLMGVPEGGLVTECACGTGGLSQYLAAHYQLTGLDQSGAMLSIAAKKLREQGFQVPLIMQDMRRVKLHKPQDAILATCDGVNYLTGDRGLSQFLRSANQALKAGGALAFDLSSIHKLRHTLGDHTLTKAEGDIRYIWRNSWQEGKRRLAMHLSIFVRQPDGLWQLIEEEQTQRGYETDELIAALKDAQFHDIRVYGNRRLSPPHEDEARIHILCKKQRDLI